LGKELRVKIADEVWDEAENGSEDAANQP